MGLSGSKLLFEISPILYEKEAFDTEGFPERSSILKKSDQGFPCLLL